MPLTFFEFSVPDDILKDLAEFASCFFGMEVKITTSTPFAGQVPNRINPQTGNAQVHAGKILTAMKSMLPRDAFCMAAITLCDLYPRDSWNFVFGLASMVDRVGVHSLARYLPNFPCGPSVDSSQMQV